MCVAFEKCFDSIWHPALFYKLKDKISHTFWLFLVKWYKGLRAVVKWKGQYSHIFTVTRGTRQGSILSPQLFNIFIDDLLQSLQHVKKGVSIGYSNYSSFAYADDVTVYSSTIPDLQFLIQMCADYATKWRFNFGIKKTKCMIVGHHKFYAEPRWKLGTNIIENVSSMDILGVAFNNNLKHSIYVNNRIQKCYRSFYSLRNAGFSYPGVHSDVKSYMWKSMCQPVLLYGSDCINLSSTDIKTMETSQGKIIKQSLGLSKYSRNTNLLQALNINKVSHNIIHSTLSLWNRLFCVKSPTQTLCSYLYGEFLSTGNTVPGTLLSRIVNSGHSPLICTLTKTKYMHVSSCNDGIVDSLRMVLASENFIKPYSEDHRLAVLLTQSF